MLLSQDNQGSLIERAYQNALLGKSSADFKSWIAKLEQVDKDAICRAANNETTGDLLYGRNRMTKVVFEEKYYPAVKKWFIELVCPMD